MMEYETQALNQGLRFIFGVDEAGRGPLAGPVVAAAVCLKTFDFDNRIDDSKAVTPKGRLKAFDEIYQKSYVGIGIMSETVIDHVNILKATYLAMDAALRQVMLQIEGSSLQDFNQQVLVLVDGNGFRSALPYKTRLIIGGDAQSISIAAASIIAKVYRDRVMEGYHQVFPQYGFNQHKGYPTAGHRQAILKHGPSLIHRRSFTL